VDALLDPKSGSWGCHYSQGSFLLEDRSEKHTPRAALFTMEVPTLTFPTFFLEHLNSVMNHFQIKLAGTAFVICSF
jgi:hypothetical protein